LKDALSAPVRASRTATRLPWPSVTVRTSFCQSGTATALWAT